MKVCFPIVENRGLLSPVAPHFCEAPSFLLVDVEPLTWRSIPNLDDGPCDARALLGDAHVDLFVMGPGAPADTSRLPAPVVRAPSGNVAGALADLIAGRLPASA